MNRAAMAAHLPRKLQHGRSGTRSLERVTGAASIVSNVTTTSLATTVRVEAASVPVLEEPKSDHSLTPPSKLSK